MRPRRGWCIARHTPRTGAGESTPSVKAESFTCKSRGRIAGHGRRAGRRVARCGVPIRESPSRPPSSRPAAVRAADGRPCLKRLRYNFKVALIVPLCR